MPEASVAVKPETSVATTRELVAGDVFNEEAIAIAAWPGAPAEVIEIDGPAPEPYVLAPSNANPVAESWRQAAVTNPERPTADTGNVSDRLPARAASHEPDSPPTHPGPAALPSADAASASSLDREVVDGRSVNRLTEPIIPGDSPLISDDLEPVVPLAEAHTLEGKAEAHTELSPWSPGSPLVTPIPLRVSGASASFEASQPSLSPLLLPQDTDQRSERPSAPVLVDDAVVQVTIGRLEIRTVADASPRRVTQSERPRVTDLDEYLRQRSEELNR